MHSHASVAGPLLFAAVTAACADTVEDRLRVSAAVSLSGPLETVVRTFEQATETPVEINFAGSDTLATQIVAGADADLFLSADARQMARVERAGLLAAGTRTDLWSNRLVVAVPADRAEAVSRLRDLATVRIRRVALGDPDAVPAGVYAMQGLRAAGVWEAVQPKVVPMRDVRSVLAAVDAGNVDAGIVYRTDLPLARAAVAVLTVPLAGGQEIRYPGAVLTRSKRPRSARRLLMYLGSPAARSVFGAAGFISVAGGADHAG